MPWRLFNARSIKKISIRITYFFPFDKNVGLQNTKKKKEKERGVPRLRGIPTKIQTRVTKERPVGDTERRDLFNGVFIDIFRNSLTMYLSKVCHIFVPEEIEEVHLKCCT